MSPGDNASSTVKEGGARGSHPFPLSLLPRYVKGGERGGRLRRKKVATSHNTKRKNSKRGLLKKAARKIHHETGCEVSRDGEKIFNCISTSLNVAEKLACVHMLHAKLLLGNFV